jgi:hypothetical protein
MSAHACCSVGAGADHGARLREKAADGRQSSLARVGALGSWIGPSALLVLLPKCPMCLAAYLALAGIGVSTTAAAGLRVGLIAGSIAVLGLAAGRLVLRITA